MMTLASRELLIQLKMSIRIQYPTQHCLERRELHRRLRSPQLLLRALRLYYPPKAQVTQVTNTKCNISISLLNWELIELFGNLLSCFYIDDKASPHSDTHTSISSRIQLFNGMSEQTVGQKATAACGKPPELKPLLHINEKDRDGPSYISKSSVEKILNQQRKVCERKRLKFYEFPIEIFLYVNLGCLFYNLQ